MTAALDLLEQHGYARLTLESVARRAGVGRPTIYRRWSTKDDLVVHVLTETVPPLEAPVTGDAVNDLRTMAIEFVTGLVNSPAGRSVLAVHAEAGRRPDLAARLREGYLLPRDRVVRDIVAYGHRHGQLTTGLGAETIRDLVFGPLIYHWLVSGDPLDPDTAATLVEAVLPAIRPPRAH
ncbi:MAG: TetR/AcrR family transcriptional regulator [Kutzneria sp.]|nr:TetR/AcrR family transcriptional regulator [Kutzneria sp.]MBV9846008.1 TetR/AcrR family transcriptional regulator [Kutzneria sp.]